MSGIAPARTTRHALGVVLAGALLCLAVCLAGPGVALGGDAGDPFFPNSGSSAYDVEHYGVRLSYQPKSGVLVATARITAIARGRLQRFTLDLNGLRVTGVDVQGAAARFSRSGGKLRIVPASPLAAGERFVAIVHYRGRPQRVIDPDDSIEGWIRTKDGALALGEPVGTAAWLPCNNTLRDKASFGFRITVPKELKGVANGRLVAVERDEGRKTFVWSESQPMAPYLAVIDIGRGMLVRSEIAGTPSWTMVDSRTTGPSRRALRDFPQIVRFEAKVFGPYPFDALGSIVDPVALGYDALETQTRPIYVVAPSRTTVVHEMAHQWFGDSIGLTRWPEIWLNEGFATWAEWYYAERHGGRTAQQTFNRLYAVSASAKEFWNPPSGHPGTAKNLFVTSVYIRGAMVLQALRTELGTSTMLTILRRWVTEHRHANVTISQFIALAEQVSGRQLDTFFSDWLYLRGKPLGYG
jgi:aminopeptidase N